MGARRTVMTVQAKVGMRLDDNNRTEAGGICPSVRTGTACVLAIHVCHRTIKRQNGNRNHDVVSRRETDNALLNVTRQPQT